jgi:superfamily I DNA/RNA helicase
MTTLNSMDKVLEKFPLMRNIELNESFRCTDNILITGENMLKPIKHRIQKKVVSKNKYNRSIYLKKYSSDKK